MMGRHVDYACRSVISPDPYIGTNEIGIPVPFAKTLSYPTPVTPWNVEEMCELVSNGADTYPGANWIEEADGRRYDLTRINETKRVAMSCRLLNHKGQMKVGRHVKYGDYMMVNHQPTLQKPRIMVHSVRILTAPKQQTIWMHYANCN